MRPAATLVKMFHRSTVDALDVQSGVPSTRVGLSRVGVTDVEKIIRAGSDGRHELYFAQLSCYVDLDPLQAGAHMSRFEEVVNEAIDDVVRDAIFRAEWAAAQIAERIRDRQKGTRSEVVIRARCPRVRRAPVSGLRTHEFFTLTGDAVADASGTRTIVGVESHGMTACPCAQTHMADEAAARLAEQGFDPGEVERILEAVPIATHNQRGTGVLEIGWPGHGRGIDARELLTIVESSMSSETYELLKRSDEAHVVRAAHRKPMFAEDCVREMVRSAIEEYSDLGDDVFVRARQENLETIHRHNVVAERHGLLSEIRRELFLGERASRHMTREEWLSGT